MSRLKHEKLEKHYRIGEAAKILGLAPINLRGHIKAGHIRAIRTPGGHFRIPESELLRLTGHPSEGEGEDERKKNCVIYARVSSQEQVKAGKLDRQVERLHKYAWDNQLNVIDVITDVGSGLSETRKGITKLFKHTQAHNMDYVLIEFRERLARYGYRYIRDYLASNEVEILVKEADEKVEGRDEDLNKELVEDLISIIYSFSGKLYGRRSAKFRELRRCVEQAHQSEE
ncbi:MAG: IS607 family transposase [Candidatus Hodarchaeota archaeon]